MIDNVLAVVGLIVFVYLCYQVGKLVNRFKHRRFTRAWQPLIGIINGKVREDPQGGGASSWLAGQWKGRTIHARMSPQVRSWEWSQHQNRFAVGVADLDGRANWRILAQSELDVSSDDRRLEEHLRSAGVVALMQRAGCASARFERHSRYLFVEEDVAPLWTPPPERFIVLLDLAVELARVQGGVNAPTP